MNTTIPASKSNSVLRVISATALVLLVPLLAMQFNDEVNWSPRDILIIGSLLLGTGFIYEFVVKRVVNKKQRVILSTSLFLALLLIWAELAVGVFNSPLSAS